MSFEIAIGPCWRAEVESLGVTDIDGMIREIASIVKLPQTSKKLSLMFAMELARDERSVVSYVGYCDVKDDTALITQNAGYKSIRTVLSGKYRPAYSFIFTLIHEMRHWAQEELGLFKDSDAKGLTENEYNELPDEADANLFAYRNTANILQKYIDKTEA